MRAVRPLVPADRAALAEHLRAAWGSPLVASRGRLHQPVDEPGFVAVDDEAWLGYATYEVIGDELEVVALDCPVPGQGAGSALLASCVSVGLERRLARLWLVTTNDNTDALRFYQRRGFVLAALRREAVVAARRTLMPEIAAIGAHGIPIRDELELELPRPVWPDFVSRYRWRA